MRTHYIAISDSISTCGLHRKGLSAHTYLVDEVTCKTCLNLINKIRKGSIEVKSPKNQSIVKIDTGIHPSMCCFGELPIGSFFINAGSLRQKISSASLRTNSDSKKVFAITVESGLGYSISNSTPVEVVDVNITTFKKVSK